jgi:hypothetical protein
MVGCYWDFHMSLNGTRMKQLFTKFWNIIKEVMNGRYTIRIVVLFYNRAITGVVKHNGIILIC